MKILCYESQVHPRVSTEVSSEYKSKALQRELNFDICFQFSRAIFNFSDWYLL